MTKNNNNSFKINGPLNVVRLEGEINKIKKVIYVFFDIHIDVDQQTKCDDFEAVDITNYLAKEFKAIPDKEIDFFMESNTSQFDMFLKYMYFKDKYVAEVIKFFAQNFKQSKFENVRFHYIDIRDFFTEQIDKIYNSIEGMLDNLSQSNLHSVEILISNFKTIQKYHDEIIKTIKGKDSHSDDDKNILINGDINKYIKKLSGKYTNPDVKEKIMLFQFIIIEKLEKLNKTIDKIINVLTKFQKIAASSFDEFRRRIIIDDIQNDDIQNDDIQNDDEQNYKIPSYSINDISYMRKLSDLYHKIKNDNIYTFALLMDSYFMRRFCDKDYITNAISYTGAAHSMAYINFLVNQFDFKITHAAKSSIPIDELNKKLKNEFNFNKFAKYLFPKTLLQCVDLSDFPKNFD